MRSIPPLFLFASLAILSGCAKKAVVPDAPVTTSAPVSAAPAPVAAATPVKESSTSDELAALLRQTVLQFSFDDASLTSQSQEKLRTLADGLRRRPGASVRIAGHCDERGTVEYNLALGQRRATAARHYLVQLGVPEATVDTVSFGAERPVADGHDEDAWAKNRRAEAEPLQR